MQLSCFTSPLEDQLFTASFILSDSVVIKSTNLITLVGDGFIAAA